MKVKFSYRPQIKDYLRRLPPNVTRPEFTGTAD